MVVHSVKLLSVAETLHGRRNQKENPKAVGPTPDYDNCHAQTGWLATGDYRRLRKRRAHSLLPVWPGQPEGAESGAR